MKLSRVLVPLALLALVGCTPMQWQHPQFGTSRSSLDAADCERSAYYEAMSRPYHIPNPPFVRGRDGRLYPNRADNFNDSFFYQSQLQDYCMRVKGYQLVPVPG